jgi:uncharacterized protein YciI
MKKIFQLLLLLIVLNLNTKAQYDSALAKKLNADEYGMRSYVLVMLKIGTAESTDKKVTDSIFKGHMNNIQKLASENKLVLAGPMGKNDKNYEGVFVFNTSSIDEAKQWLSTDPAFQAKYLDAELYPWYCTATLQEIPALHKQVQKTNF